MGEVRRDNRGFRLSAEQEHLSELLSGGSGRDAEEAVNCSRAIGREKLMHIYALAAPAVTSSAK